MISLTRLNGERIALNEDLIERAEATPDTVLTLINGTKYLVAETLDEVTEAIQVSRATILALAGRLQPPAASGTTPRLRVLPTSSTAASPPAAPVPPAHTASSVATATAPPPPMTGTAAPVPPARTSGTAAPPQPARTSGIAAPPHPVPSPAPPAPPPQPAAPPNPALGPHPDRPAPVASLTPPHFSFTPVADAAVRHHDARGHDPEHAPSRHQASEPSATGKAIPTGEPIEPSAPHLPAPVVPARSPGHHLSWRAHR